MLRLGNAEFPEAAEGPNETSALEQEIPGTVIGRYRLLERIGEGGFGIVWMAEQTEPMRRNVALKIIKLGMDTRQVVARFEAERQALALREHPNIARVFDGGATSTGRPFFVMELVRGIPLTAYCDNRKLATPERLQLFIQVCEAVQHAHHKGVIHRDLKPSNILVTEQNGRAVPKVIDFGIAKATATELTEKTLFTRFNQMMGTPAYMSPEQAGLGSLDVDTRTDIYSLGVVLYELLTGRTPLDSHRLVRAGHEALLKAIREVEPARPSTHLSTLTVEDLQSLAGRRREPPQRLHQLVRGDLDWIVLKALEKNRSRRYESANGLASDLQRFLRNEAVTAVPPTLAYQFNKFARRRRTALITAGAFLAVLLAAIVVSIWQAVRATRLAVAEREASQKAQAANNEARRNLAQARLNAYASEINVARQALEENNLHRALELLDRHRPKSGEGDLRGFEWRYLWQQARPNELASFRGKSESVAFSPDGSLIAIGGVDKVTLIGAKSLAVMTHLVAAVPGSEFVSLAFSPRGDVLAGACYLGAVYLWDTRTWQSLPSPPGATMPVRFSPDGAWMITGMTNAPGQPPRHRLWRTDTWEPAASCPATPELAWQLRNAVAFSPDGRLLATPWLQTTNEVCSMRLWKVPTLERVAELSSPDLPAWSAAFLPDGQHLLVGTFLGHVVVWDVDRRQVIEVIKESGSGITSIAVAPKAKVFATTSHDQRASLWDSATRKVVARFRGHTASMWASALSPDGALVATGSFDGTTKLWDGTARDSAGLIEQGSMIAGFTGDSRTLVLAPREGDYRWHLIGATNSTVNVPDQPRLNWNYIHRPYDLTGDAPVGVLGRTDGSVEFWNLAERRKVNSWSASSREITAARFSPDGLRLATGDTTGLVRIWNMETRGEVASFQTSRNPAASDHQPVSIITFSSDGKWLAAGAWPAWISDVVVFDMAASTVMHRLKELPGMATTLAFSPDGRLLAGDCMGSSGVHLWDIPSGNPHRPLLGHVTGVVQVEFSPDGKTLATGGYDALKIWNVATEQEMITLPMPGTFRSLGFSPDGRTLALGFLGFPGHKVLRHHAPSFDEIRAREALKH